MFSVRLRLHFGYDAGQEFIIAMLIAAIVCVSVLSVLFGIDKTFSSGESITVSLIEAGNIR